ncbi:endo alpha-1,4 polygalactosaminidase [Sphingopyxis kveilinensis]|uniref:endo alpha-1,4 polygalactosaminidase n=1 Tax=Sphingopyxis kveilinensis TaxID=3114367 RepID=UPI003BAE861E
MRCASVTGFDAVDPDEINGWENDIGFPLAFNGQLSYHRALTGWAHHLGACLVRPHRNRAPCGFGGVRSSETRAYS